MGFLGAGDVGRRYAGERQIFDGGGRQGLLVLDHEHVDGIRDGRGLRHASSLHAGRRRTGQRPRLRGSSRHRPGRDASAPPGTGGAADSPVPGRPPGQRTSASARTRSVGCSGDDFDDFDDFQTRAARRRHRPRPGRPEAIAPSLRDPARRPLRGPPGGRIRALDRGDRPAVHRRAGRPALRRPPSGAAPVLSPPAHGRSHAHRRDPRLRARRHSRRPGGGLREGPRGRRPHEPDAVPGRLSNGRRGRREIRDEEGARRLRRARQRRRQRLRVRTRVPAVRRRPLRRLRSRGRRQGPRGPALRHRPRGGPPGRRPRQLLPPPLHQPRIRRPGAGPGGLQGAGIHGGQPRLRLRPRRSGRGDGPALRRQVPGRPGQPPRPGRPRGHRTRPVAARRQLDVDPSGPHLAR